MNPRSEPITWSGALTALAVAAIPLLRAFGKEITEEQSNALLTFLSALIVFGTVALRSTVTPVEKAERLIKKAFDSDPSVDAEPTLNEGRSSLLTKIGRHPNRNQPAAPA